MKRPLIYSKRKVRYIATDPSFPCTTCELVRSDIFLSLKQLISSLGWTEYYVLTFMRYGKQLAKHRQVYQTFLSRSRCEEYKLLQAEAALELARDLIKSPQGQHHTCINK
jgi:hypothetical protein